MKPSCQIVLEALPCRTVALHRAAYTNIRWSSQRYWANDPFNGSPRDALITARLKRITLEGSRLVKFTLRSLCRLLLRVRIPMDSPRCHVSPTSHRGDRSLPRTGERSALTRPFEGTPGNQQNDRHQRHQRRKQQQQRRATDQRTARTGNGFRGWISHAVVHHVAGYRRAVRLCRGTAYRRGVHCVAGIRVVCWIPGAAAGVMGQAGGVGDRVRDVALVDAAGEQSAREGPDGEHRHILAPVRRPRPRHACCL